MENNLTPADIANLVESEVQRRMTEAEAKTRQLTREELNGMSWQGINTARAEGRLNNILLGKGE
jgi:hypothetical protein